MGCSYTCTSCVALGAGLGVRVGVGEGGAAVGADVATAVPVGVSVGCGVAVSVGAGLGAALGVAAGGVGAALLHPPQSSPMQTSPTARSHVFMGTLYPAAAGPSTRFDNPGRARL